MIRYVKRMSDEFKYLVELSAYFKSIRDAETLVFCKAQNTFELLVTVRTVFIGFIWEGCFSVTRIWQRTCNYRITDHRCTESQSSKFLQAQLLLCKYDRYTRDQAHSSRRSCMFLLSEQEVLCIYRYGIQVHFHNFHQLHIFSLICSMGALYTHNRDTQTRFRNVYQYSTDLH